MSRAGSLPIRFVVCFLAFSLLLGACGRISNLDDEARRTLRNLASEEAGFVPDAGTRSPSVGIEAPIPVDPLFAEFYAFFGGEAKLGPVISQANQVGSQVHQYVQAGLMVYDPEAPEAERYRWAPLGEGFEVREEPVTDPGGDARFINGHTVYPGFEAKFDELGGVRFVGEPLFEARYSLAHGRIEQYFGNLGFYILDEDTAQEVRLIAYGAYACDERCRQLPPGYSLPELSPPLREPYRTKAAEFGLAFIGKTLTDARPGFDGKPEVVFENMVLAQKDNASSIITARPIVTTLGLSDGSPIRYQGPRDLMEFIHTDGELGHYVPAIFLNYLERRGGLVFFGNPVSEVIKAGEGVFRQYFASVCIEFDLNRAPANRIRLASIGQEYLSRYPTAGGSFDPYSLDGVKIHAWEREPSVSTDELQEIFVKIFLDGRPVANREPIIRLTMPDGSDRVLKFPPTDAEGQTSRLINPISAPNATLIAYDVCLKSPVDEICVGDNYLIWNYPK